MAKTDKEVTERELVEYLDDKKYHVVMDRIQERKGLLPIMICSCGHRESIPHQMNKHQDRNNPTPTLEWMLDALDRKGLVGGVDNHSSKNGLAYDNYEGNEEKAWSGIVMTADLKKDFTAYANTPTQALRGAVEEMMEAE